MTWKSPCPHANRCHGWSCVSCVACGVVAPCARADCPSCGEHPEVLQEAAERRARKAKWASEGEAIQLTAGGACAVEAVMTTRAGLIPWDRGKAWLFLARGADITPLRVWGVEGDEVDRVGRLVCVAHHRENCQHCREVQEDDRSRSWGHAGKPRRFGYEVTVEDAARLARGVAEELRRHGVELLVIEQPVGVGASAQHGATIASGVRAAVTGIPVEGRPATRGEPGMRAAVLLGLARATSVPAGTVETSKAAAPRQKPPSGPSPGYVAGLPPAAVDASKELAVALKDEGPGMSPEPSARVAPFPPLSGAVPGGLSSNALHRPRQPEGEAAEPSAQALRLGAVDPGERWLHVSVGEEDASAPGRVRLIASQLFTVGRVVPLGKPKVERRRDGSTYVKTERYLCEDDDLRLAIEAVLAFLADHRVTKVAVERATHFHGGEDASPGRAVGLLRSETIGSEIAGALRMWLEQDDGSSDVGEVSRCSSAVWRARCRKAALRAGLVSKPAAPPPADGKPAKALPVPWRAAVRALLPGPEGEHALDSRGLLVWLALPEEEPAAPKPAKPAAEPKAPTKRAPRQLAPLEPLLDALRAHGRPMRLDVLAAELRITVGQATALLRRAESEALVVKPSRGLYALATAPAAPPEAPTPAQQAMAEGRRLPPGTVRVPFK